MQRNTKRRPVRHLAPRSGRAAKLITMNEFILNLAGFTPEEWREFKGRVANKILFYWRAFIRELTLERLRAGFFILLVAGIGLFGIQRGVRYLAQRSADGGQEPKEATQSAGPSQKKEQLEVSLEGLKKTLDTVLETPADLKYPSLDLKVSFE